MEIPVSVLPPLLLLAPQADNIAASRKQAASEPKFFVRSIDRVLECRPEVPVRLQKESELVEFFLRLDF
jgi:hypothetical protein